MADEQKIPKGRVRRSTKLASAVGGQAARYAGTAAANVGRSEQERAAKLEDRHLQTALKMLKTLGEMKGAALKLGQLASFIDTEFLPPEFQEIYQRELAKLRTAAPSMPWEQVREVLVAEYEGAEPESVFAEIEQEAFAAASIGQVHRATLTDGRRVAVKIQYPGIAEALEADMRNAGMLIRLGKALAPGLDPKELAAELRERILEELDYELEASKQRQFARGYRGHPFIFVPAVERSLSRRRVLVSEFVEGISFDEVLELDQAEKDRFGEIIYRFSFGSIYHLQHFNADPHPGNYILMGDGRVAFIDFGMTKTLDPAHMSLQQLALDAAFRNDAEGLRKALHDLGFIKNPSKTEAEMLMEHAQLIGGWYMRDEDRRISKRYVAKVIEATTDPRSEFYSLMRRESLPADELMGRRMETGVLAVLAQLGAKRNWHRILREWLYADEPETELGKAEWDYFEGRGVVRTPGIASYGEG